MYDCDHFQKIKKNFYMVYRFNGQFELTSSFFGVATYLL